MSTNKFKAGDTVRCVHVINRSSWLRLGEYIVHKVYPSGAIEVVNPREDYDCYWTYDQFELIVAPRKVVGYIFRTTSGSYFLYKNRGRTDDKSRAYVYGLNEACCYISTYWGHKRHGKWLLVYE